MNIEFNLFKLKKDSKTYKQWSTKDYMQKELDCDIIIVSEEMLGDKLYLRGLTVGEKGLCLIGGLGLEDNGYYIPEEDLERTSFVSEYNIHKKYLSVGMVENIQRINERLIG